MYVPSAFSEDRIDLLHDLIRSHPFATLVSTPTGLPSPVVTHLPLLLDVRPDRSSGTLVGHVARVNEHANALRAGSHTLAIFHGPHAYVSPRWYATTPSVPTWNYAVVHAAGTPRIVANEANVLDLLRRTTSDFEPADGGWRADDLSRAYLKSMAAGVVAFELPIATLTGKFKLGQNRSTADRTRVIDALASGTENDRATARLMLNLSGADGPAGRGGGI